MAKWMRLRERRNRPSWSQSVLACVTVLLGWATSAPTVANAATAPSIQANIGINGYYDTDHLVPVYVTISNHGGAAKATLQVSANHLGIGGNRSVDGDLSFPVNLPARGSIHKEIAVPGSFIGQATLSCVEGGITTSSVGLSGNLLGKVALVAVVSTHIQAAQFLTGSSAGTGGEPIMAERIGPGDLPQEAGLLESLTAVTMTPDTFAALTSRQQDALKTWVNLGGLLIVTGTSKQRVLSHIEMPFQAAPTKSVSGSALVHALGESAQPLSGHIEINGKVTSNQVDLLAGTKSQPLIGSLQVGRGTVIQTDFSPTKILSWGGSTALWTQVVGAGLKSAKPVFPHFNGADGVYTLTNASDSLSPLRVPSLKFWGSIFLLYVLAIGPILFYFLRTTRKEPWGWIILPVVSIVTTAAIYGFGVSQRPNGLLAEGVGVLELTGSGNAASYGMTAFTSPFVTKAVAQAGNVQFALPLAGSNEKGLGDATSEMGQTTNVVFNDIPRWGLRYVYTTGTVNDQGEFVPSLEETYGAVTGAVQNRTPYAIHDAALIWHGNMYQLGDINPGDTVWIDNETAKHSFSGTWLPTYGRYNGDLTHGLGRVLGSYLAEQPERGLQNNQAVLVGTTTANQAQGEAANGGSNTPSTVDLSTRQKIISRQDIVFVRQFVNVTLTTLQDMPSKKHQAQSAGGVAP